MGHCFYSGDHESFVVPATFYVRPNGDVRPQHLPIDEDVCDKADKIINSGFVFECEILMTDQFSITITSSDMDHVFIFVDRTDNAHLVTRNKLSKAIREFDIQLELEKLNEYA